MNGIKTTEEYLKHIEGFRSMSYWMVLKLLGFVKKGIYSFRSMSYWMVLKLLGFVKKSIYSFRSMSYWMVLKLFALSIPSTVVLDLCHIEWY